MGRIAIAVSRVGGDVRAASQMARRLREQGHEVEVWSPFGVEALAGDGFRPIGRDHGERPRLGRPGGRLAAYARAWDSRMENPDATADEADRLDLDLFEEAVDFWQPDLLLINVELPAHVIAASSRSRPLATWATQFTLRKHPGVPPLGSTTIPGQGVRGTRAAIAAEWAIYRLGKASRIPRARMLEGGRDWISVLEEVSRRYRFDLEKHADLYQWWKPVVFRSIPHLVLNAEEMELPHRPHPTERYVGPALRSPVDLGELGETGDRLASIRREGKVVYAGFGTWHRGDDRDFIEKLFEAVAPRPDWNLVIGLGGRVPPEAVGAAPDNAHLFEHAPQVEALQLADCALHHGGVSSANEAVAAGVPSLVYPFGYRDMPGTAARLAFHGLGVVGDRDQGPEQIRESIDRILGDDDMRRRVDAMSRVYERYVEELRLEREVAGLLGDER